MTLISTMRLSLDDRSQVLVLTGAGVSAESGIPTFRDAGGLWEGHDVTEVASPQGFFRDPLLVWKFYSERRAGMAGVHPNAAHHALVALEARLGDRFLLATQNIDGLHTAAGSQRLVEMHGNLMRSRCTRCDRAPFADTTAYRASTVPMCRQCKSRKLDSALRPDVVWFGEPLSPRALDRIETFITSAGASLVFLSIGTSGLVYPAAGLVHTTRRAGGQTWCVNLDRPANASEFEHVVLGPATTTLPALFA